MTSAPSYEQVYQRAEEGRGENELLQFLDTVRADPGIVFEPQYLALMAEIKQLDLAEYHRVRGILARDRIVDTRAWDEAVAKAKPNGAAIPDADVQQRAEYARTQLIKWPDLADSKAPPRQFILQDWIPARSVTLLHGFGGVGKSLLMQQIGTAGAFKREFLGGTVDSCPVLAWWGEDDHDEIWRRQENINAALAIPSIAELDGKVFWRTCPGDDITLFTGANESDFRTTAEFAVLREQIRDLKVGLAILDSATQIAAIPEGNRPLVTRCMQALTRICIEAPTTIVLLGHNNRAQGDFSGSSAWENRARSRIHMKRDKDEDGAETIKLARPKANYANIEEGVAIEWHHGAYRCADARFETYGDRLDRECRERQVDEAFLDALDQLSERRLATSASKQAPNFAPRFMVQNGVANGCSALELERAMRRLFRDGRIIADAKLWQKPNRHFASGLARKS
jgi:RecA-family ATPase